ncbi:MAG: universal stress protein [Lacisediminihabitans sp.]
MDIEEDTTAQTASARGGPSPSSAYDGGRIVVGVDGSESSIDALRQGIRFATMLHASLEAINTWSYIAYEAVPVGWFPEEDAKQVVADAADAVFGKTWPEWFRASTREGSPARVLIEESEGAEMLIVGSRGHGGFAGLLLGSVSSQCAEHAHCPVLVVHKSTEASIPAS